MQVHAIVILHHEHQWSLDSLSKCAENLCKPKKGRNWYGKLLRFIKNSQKS